MRQQIRFLTRALGRRETIKYLSIVVVGTAIAPLTGCSGSTLAFKKFAAGTWDISFDDIESWKTAVLTVSDGKWELQAERRDGDEKEAAQGVWSMSGTSVSVEETGEERHFVYEYRDVASGVPEEVNTEEMPASITWTHGTDEGEETATRFEFSVQWDRADRNLTLRRNDSLSGVPFSLTAQKRKK